MSITTVDEMIQDLKQLSNQLYQVLGLGERKDRYIVLKNRFNDISVELEKKDSDEDLKSSNTPIDDMAGKVKQFIRGIAEESFDTKKAEKSIDGLFGVFKRAIKDAVSTKPLPKNSSNPLNNVLGKMKEALEVAVTEIPKGDGIGDRFARKYPKILNAFVSKQHQNKAIYIINKQVEFGLLHDCYRPTLRDPHARTISGEVLHHILDAYHDLRLFDDDIMTYLTEFDRDPAGEMMYQLPGFPLEAEGDLIAAEIDFGNQELIGFISNILNEEESEYTIHSGIVRGIVMSHNKSLLNDLIQMLLNAGLEEGVRQCICENMDAGTLEAQTEIFKAICTHNLIRYSSVRRALVTQTGLDTTAETFMRVSDRSFEYMKKVMFDENQCEALIQSTDLLQIAMGIWGLYMRDRQKAVTTVKRVLQEGNREQMIASSHNAALYLQDEGTRMQYAKYVLDHYADDPCVLAAWFRLFICMDHMLFRNVFHCFDDRGDYISGKYKADPIPLAPYFESEQEARDYYGKLKTVLERIPAGDYCFEDIMPWDSIWLTKKNVLKELFLIAWMLQDVSLLTELAPRHSETGGTSEECLLIATWNAETREQRNVLFNAAIRGDDYEYRVAEFIIKNRITLIDDDYRFLRDYFRLKSVRQGDYLYNIFMKAPYEIQLETIQYLLKNKKDMRMAGLEFVIRLKNDEKQQSTFEKARSMVEQLKKVTAAEQIIVDRILEKPEVSEEKDASASLYIPNTVAELPKFDGDHGYILELFNRWMPEYINVLQKLDHLIDAHKDYSYIAVSGEDRIIGNKFLIKISYEPYLEEIDKYPLADVWKAFYEKEIASFEALMIFVIAMEADEDTIRFVSNLYGVDLSQTFCMKDRKDNKRWKQIKYAWHCYEILTSLYLWQAPKHISILSEAVRSLATTFMEKPAYQTYYYDLRNNEQNLVHNVFSSSFRYIFHNYQLYGGRTEFKTYYAVYQTLNRFYGVSGAPNNLTRIDALDHIRAYSEHIISKDAVYCELFNIPLKDVLCNIRPFVTGNEIEHFGDYWLRFSSEEHKTIKGNPLYAATQELYWPMMDVILDTEIRRSEQDTKYSEAIRYVPMIRGVRRLVEILVALDHDGFSRCVCYVYNFESNKQVNLSRLLFVSEPAPGEDVNTLRACLKGQKISEDRLVDVAMFNDRWAPLIEKYLGWEGLVSGVCFFFAHVGESYGSTFEGRMERRKALIARYTPIDFEDFAKGAIDIGWFWETYNQLGEKRFQKLYKSAKYISGNNIHTRARKYTDALLGKFDIKETEELLMAKRNKDLLMAYPLIPLNGENDILRRYQFIQLFKKSSQNFGPQRRASEVAVIEMAIKNLAIHAGFEDVNRFILYMEAKLTDSHASAFEWTTVDDNTEIRLALTEDNCALALECRKDGKVLKNVPSKLSKHATVQGMKAILSQLKDQISRSRQMFEEFMEKGTELGLEELQMLVQNRLVGPMIKKLVFMLGERSVYYGASGFENPQGIKFNLSPDVKFRIAHPYDLYKNGDWSYYQKYIFDHQIKQPFKQVFRELYVMTEEERERNQTMRFSGNQIKPQRAVGCLKKRLWTASYEDGLQKVYYKENVIAEIYSEADWYSPSDVECPTLEYVCFYDRKTYSPLKIKDVPPVIFSEVMRDVDLVVSIAHVGDVDPETSHSTIEMRKIIAEYNVQLFGLKNVSFMDRFVIIEGKRASYRIHLGSGVIFQEGGTQIAVLPVHSQHRGKLFLPFVDEDPKTAEIMTKIIFFANDMKIKDPYIVSQIHTTHDEAKGDE